MNAFNHQSHCKRLEANSLFYCCRNSPNYRLNSLKGDLITKHLLVKEKRSKLTASAMITSVSGEITSVSGVLRSFLSVKL